MDSHVLVAFACLATTAMALVPMSASSELKAPAGRVHRTRALYAQQGQYGQSQFYDQNGFEQSQFGRPQQSGFAQGACDGNLEAFIGVPQAPQHLGGLHST